MQNNDKGGLYGNEIIGENGLAVEVEEIVIGREKGCLGRGWLSPLLIQFPAQIPALTCSNQLSVVGKCKADECEQIKARHPDSSFRPNGN